MIVDRPTAEKCGQAFQVEGMMGARELTRAATRKIAESITVGMTELEAFSRSEAIFTEMGVVRKWHSTKIRFGENTTLSFGYPSKPQTVLQENDIFFIDVGPVFDGFEGDYGETFTVGADPEMARAAADARGVFESVRDRWRETGETGQLLYQYATKEAARLGWVLNLHQTSGHRLSDFPHTLHFKGALADLAFSPSPAIWVLEILIRHPSRPFGAFYEDLLVR